MARKAKKTKTKRGKAARKAPKKPAKKAAKRTAKRAAAPRKPKSRLSKPTLEKFRQMLLDKRRALLGDMSGIEAEAFRGGAEGSAGDLSSMPTHPADIGTDNYEHEFSLGLLESERALLGEIGEALERIDNGTYGICLGTGKPISKARLSARPWARYGIEYAHMIEQGLVRPGEADDTDEDT